MSQVLSKQEFLEEPDFVGSIFLKNSDSPSLSILTGKSTLSATNSNPKF